MGSKAELIGLLNDLASDLGKNLSNIDIRNATIYAIKTLVNNIQGTTINDDNVLFERLYEKIAYFLVDE